MKNVCHSAQVTLVSSINTKIIVVKFCFIMYRICEINVILSLATQNRTKRNKFISEILGQFTFYVVTCYQ